MDIKKYRILVATDSFATRYSVINSLNPIDADYFYVQNGKQGLNLTDDIYLDLIITDTHMPEMDGITFCKALKENSSTQGIPVILIGNMVSTLDINNGFNAGAAAHISMQNIDKKLYYIVNEELKKVRQHQSQYILVVDDSPLVLNFVGKGLMQAGFRIMKAENGRKALDMMYKRKPDLILSDIIMPEMDGFAFLAEVRSIPEFSSIPFVVMSTRSDRAYIKRMVSAGAASYITKPFHPEQLIILVENILSTQFQILLNDRERLNLEQKQMLISITSLVTALEARDPYTRGHSESVSSIATSLFTHMGMSRKQIERAAIGARLHDIGKIGIKDKVLLKPGPLTEEEFQHIKQHPIIGINIIKNIPHMEDIIPIIQFHHERFDGNGYPSGLKAGDIPLYANVVAIADTYDSLTSDRPYRKKRSKEHALQIIRENRGTQFNPEFVDIFLKCMQ